MSRYGFRGKCQTKMNESEEVYERLKKAVELGDAHEVQSIIDFYGLKYKEEWRELQGYKLLCLAVKNYKLEVIKTLFSIGCSVDNKALWKYGTPLHFAMLQRNVSLVDSLLGKGAVLEARSYGGYSPLNVAAKCGNTRLAEVLIHRGALVNTYDNKGNSPLHHAVKRNAELTSLLVKFGASVNQKNNDSSTPLHIAVARGSLETVKVLVNKGAAIDVKNNKNETPLKIAYDNDRVDVVLILLEASASVSHVINDLPFHVAVQELDYHKVKELLMENVDVNLTTVKCNITPIYLAVTTRDARMCKLLLEAKADPYICDSGGKSPLLIAVKNNDHKVVEVLIQSKTNVNLKEKNKIHPFIGTAEKGHELLFGLLVMFENEKWTQTVMKDDEHSLVYGVLKEYPLIVDYVLKYFEVVQESLKTCLEKMISSVYPDSENLIKRFIESGYRFSRAFMNNAETIKAVIIKSYFDVIDDMLLLGMDANVRLERNSLIYTPLELAVNFKQEYILEKLLMHGAVIDVEDKISPLFNAFNCEEYYEYNCGFPMKKMGKNYELIELLLDWGARLDQKTEKDQTLLHVAVIKGDLKIVELLLQHGINVNCENNNGLTPLHLAAIEGSANLFNLMLENGFDFNAEDRHKCTLLDLMEVGHPATEKMTTSYLQHLVKMKAANFFLKEIYSHLPLNRIEPHFQDNCFKELAAMKNDDIGGSGITFYDILSHSPLYIALYYKVENFQNGVKANTWQVKYPLYRSMLDSKLSKAKRRKKLLDTVELIFDDIFSSLPELCYQKIFGYFTDQELRKLTMSFRCILPKPFTAEKCQLNCSGTSSPCSIEN